MHLRQILLVLWLSILTLWVANLSHQLLTAFKLIDDVAIVNANNWKALAGDHDYLPRETVTP